MLDLRDLDARQVLAVAGLALVAPLGLELEDGELRAALVPDDLRGDLDLAQVVLGEDGVVGAEQDGLEVDLAALVAGEALHEKLLALLDAVLLTAGFHDRVRHAAGQDSVRHSPEPDDAVAFERRPR